MAPTAGLTRVVGETGSIRWVGALSSPGSGVTIEAGSILRAALLYGRPGEGTSLPD
ncbi:hypothetical protein BQ8420_05350 [Nocardiopsis sp. JB363]|nr:hypothetical protein BQ8420_05350 [Nocardiopsis sp. JB363]